MHVHVGTLAQGVDWLAELGEGYVIDTLALCTRDWLSIAGQFFGAPPRDLGVAAPFDSIRIEVDDKLAPGTFRMTARRMWTRAEIMARLDVYERLFNGTWRRVDGSPESESPDT